MKKTVPLCALVCVLMMFGCAPRKAVVQEPPKADAADEALTKAAAAIHNDLRLLAADEYAGPVPPSSNTLASTTEMRFTGELEQLVQDVGRNVGYAVKTRGKRPIQAIIVTIYSIDPISWFHILQSAGVQAGDRAEIEIDEPKKTIWVSYGGIRSQAPASGQARKPAPVKKAGTVVPSKSQTTYKPTVRKTSMGRGVSGDIRQAAGEIAGGLGYASRIEGRPSAFPVSASAPDWKSVAMAVNEKSPHATIFIDDVNRSVVLKYWK